VSAVGSKFSVLGLESAALLFDLVPGDRALHSGHHAALLDGQVDVAADGREFEPEPVRVIDDVLELSRRPGESVYIPYNDSPDQARRDVPHPPLVGRPGLAAGGAHVIVLIDASDRPAHVPDQPLAVRELAFDSET
jgi:hypothetical protein